MKRKIDKKGFTLIELLAVIVLMLAISVIAVSSISAAIERNKDKQKKAKIEIIEGYAELYYQEHKNQLSKKEKGCISLNSLGLTDQEMKDSDGKLFDGEVIYEKEGKNSVKFYYLPAEAIKDLCK